MRVMDMNKCGSASLKPTALAFNLVSKILMKRTAKRVAAAERKQRKLQLAGLLHGVCVRKDWRQDRHSTCQAQALSTGVLRIY